MSLRNLMSQRKSAMRISHPFAKYDGRGQLHCTLCQPSLIKNEQLWSSHLNSKGHREKAQQHAQEVQAQQEQREAEEAQARQQAKQLEDEAHARQQQQQESSNKKRAAEDEAEDPGQDAIKRARVQPEPEAEEDPEWDALERDILNETVDPTPSTSQPSAASNMISAQPKLVDPNAEPQEQDGEQEAAEDQDEDEQETKESEAERREREDKEELMQRIDDEEREQQEADARVSALKARLDAMRKKRQTEK